MKTSFTFLLFFLAVTGLLAQTTSTISECIVKIGFVANKTNPVSYSFKTDPYVDGAKYYWTFSDGQISDNPNPTKSFKASGTYSVSVKIAKNDQICYGKLEFKYELGTSNSPTILTGKGKVKKLATNDGCGLLITLENGTVIVPLEIVPAYEFKDGLYIELAYEFLREKPSGCPSGISAKIYKIAEIIVPTVCKVPITFEKINTTPVSYKFRTEAQPTDSKFYWYFGDGGSSALVDPTYVFKKSGNWVINLKIVDKAGKVCYGETKATFEGETNPPLAGRGKVKKLALEGCDLVIVLENATLIPVKMATDFLLKEGQ